MRYKEESLKSRVTNHNLQHIPLDDDNLNDEDLGADAVDHRVQKQIERMINEDLKKVKKGSKQYQVREQADLRRVKDSFLNMKSNQKKIMLELK